MKTSDEDINGETTITRDNYNVFRDSPLRYAGYANEVGESFRYQFPRFVVPSYAIAFGYCFADAATTGWKAYRKEIKNDGSGDKGALRHATVGAFDTLLWQSLASVAIPGACINILVKAARFSVQKSPIGLPFMLATWLPTATGLGSIPFIIHPIDRFVDYLLDNTVRPMWNDALQ
jgi:mitochondrial fission process protein 1